MGLLLIIVGMVQLVRGTAEQTATATGSVDRVVWDTTPTATDANRNPLPRACGYATFTVGNRSSRN